jgi:hypothetical protein
MFADEELARNGETGRLIHQVIATLAADATPPTPERIKRAVSAALPGYAPIEARAHRQNITSGVFVYFRYLVAPAGWRFLGSEMSLGLGRVDLVWRDDRGLTLLDEIKTGSSRQLELSRTHRQISMYLDCARQEFGDRLAGLRVLSTSDPRRSLFVHPDGEHSPLFATPYRKAA